MSRDLTMAERRKNVSKKPKEPVLADEKLRRHERYTLFLYLLGFPAIVAGMVVLSEFLSQGEPSRIALYIAGGLTAAFAIAFGVVYLLRRRSDNA